MPSALRTLARPALALGAAALLAAGLSACSSGGTTATAAGSRATTSSAASSSSPASSTPTTSAPAAATATQIAADVAKATSTKKSAAFTMQIGAASQKITASGAFRFTPGNLGMRMEMKDLPGTTGGLSMVLVKDALYIKLPPGQSPVKGKSWLKASATGTDPLSQQLAPMFEQMQQSIDPAANLGVLKGATEVSKLGNETVDGVQTTKYAFTVDVAKAAAAATGASAKTLQALSAQGVKTIDYTMWVDGQNLPRKFETSQKTAQGDVTVTGTYSHWGEPVDISAPPASQTFSASQLSGSGS